jgi:hypothetical protein
VSSCQILPAKPTGSMTRLKDKKLHISQAEVTERFFEDGSRLVYFVTMVLGDSMVK